MISDSARAISFAVILYLKYMNMFDEMRSRAKEGLLLVKYRQMEACLSVPCLHIITCVGLSLERCNGVGGRDRERIRRVLSSGI
jgi:hypothetical protein